MANKPKIKSKKPRYVICASGGGGRNRMTQTAWCGFCFTTRSAAMPSAAADVKYRSSAPTHAGASGGRSYRVAR